MISRRLSLVLVAFVLSVASAPAGLRMHGCGLVVPTSDPELRASFERFDRRQSPTAARACAAILNARPAI